MSYGFIHNSQNLETTQMSIKKTMDKQIMQISNKNEQTADAQKLISQTLCWEEKARIKKYTLCDPIYMKFWNRQN